MDESGMFPIFFGIFQNPNLDKAKHEQEKVSVWFDWIDGNNNWICYKNFLPQLHLHQQH